MSFPKPPKKERPPRAFNSSLPAASKPMARNKAPIPRHAKLERGGPPKRENRARKLSAFARSYHSKARVRFVKSLPCAADGRGPCDNAHIPHESAGAGLKAIYQAVIPLCSGINGCHAKQHRDGWSGLGMNEEGRRRAAENTEEAWREHCARTGDEP